MRAYARQFGEDEEAWGNVALLHDFDYERHPTLDKHPQDGAPVLRERGYPEWFIRAIQSHGDHTGVHARVAARADAVRVRRGVGVRPRLRARAAGRARARWSRKSVRKKLKQPSFAARRQPRRRDRGAEQLGVDLDEHIAFVIAALRPIAAELGLPG